jgi:hypothetical protein
MELPELIISEELIERIQFSVASRNAEAKLSECAVHVFAAPYSDNPHDINWQYVSSGVSCLLRNRELAKNGRKYMWSVSLCLYNASYGVLVWKARLLPNSDYTAVADNFHVFALGEVNVLIGLLFSSKEKACELHTTYTKWHQERLRDDGKKGFVSAAAQSGNEPARFRKDMISKPCNFQHIQGTQAIDECMDIEKIKADIVAALFGLGTKAGRSEAESDGRNQKSKKKRKETVKQRLEFKEIILPTAQSSVSPPPITSSPTDPSLPEVAGYVPDYAQMMHQDSHAQIAHQDSHAQIAHQDSHAQIVHQDSHAQIVHQDSHTQIAHQDGHTQIMRQDSQQGMTPTSGQSGQFNLETTAGQKELQNSGEQQLMPDPMEQLLSKHAVEPNGYKPQDLSNGMRGMAPENTPNFQNPASPAFQEYSYSIEPPRLDMSLEKEFADSVLFKSSIVTAN